MTQARITINNVAGSNDNLPINTLVQLNNVDAGGESTFNWAILDQPPGPADVLSAANIQNPTFTPRKEGTYLLQLIVNKGLPDQQLDTKVAAVRQLLTFQRQPAAGETTQDDLVRGWATALNAFLVTIDSAIGDPGVWIGVNTSGSPLARGTVVKSVSTAVVKAGLPGQVTLSGFVPALATLQANVRGLLAVVESDTTGNTTVAAGALMRVRHLGRFSASTVASGVAGDAVYVDNTGALSATAGTVLRQVGTIQVVNGGVRDILFDGVGGFEITPINAPYVVYGNPGMLTNAFRIDGDNAASALGGLAPTFASGDASTRSLVAKRFSSGQTVNVIEVVNSIDSLAYFAVKPDGTVEWKTDSADGNGVVVGAMDWKDVNSVAADQRIAQVLVTLDGSVSDNRGGQISFLVKTDGASGLATVAQIGGGTTGVVGFGQGASGVGLFGVALTNGQAVIGTVGGTPGSGNGVAGSTNGSGAGVLGQNSSSGPGVSGLNSGSSNGVGGDFQGGATAGIGVRGTGGSTGTGVVGHGGSGGGIGVTGIATAGGAAAVFGDVISGGGPAFQGNANVDLSSQSAPASTTGVGPGVYNRANNCRAWGAVHTTNVGGISVTAGQNIASVSLSDPLSLGANAFVVNFTTGFSAANSYAVNPSVSFPSTIGFGPNSFGVHVVSATQFYVYIYQSGSLVNPSVAPTDFFFQVFGS